MSHMDIALAVLPRSNDDRRPFPVTDPSWDAPDGAVIELSGDPAFPERHGLWQRHGDEWVPVAADEGGEFPCTSCGKPGWDCLYAMNCSPNERRCCGDCGINDTHSKQAILRASGGAR